MKPIWRILVLAVLAIGGLATVGIGQVQPGIRTKPRIDPGITIRPKRAPVEKTEPATEVQQVDWSYVQRNFPGMITKLSSQVKAGKLNARVLGGLVNPGQLNKLMDEAPPEDPDEDKPPTEPQPEPNPNPGAGSPPNKSGGISGKAISSLAKTRSTISVAMLFPLEAPFAVNFGDVYDGQRVRKAIYVRNVPSGKFTADLRTNSPFRIVEMSVSSGILQRISEFAIAGSLFQTGSSEYDPNSGILSQASKAKTAPLFSKGSQGSGGGGIGARIDTKVSTSALLRRTKTTEAPWELDAEEGNTVRIVIEFRPKFGLSNGDPVGLHKNALKLACASRDKTVEIAGKFNGINIGAFAIPDSREFDLIIGPKTEKHPSGGNMVPKLQKVVIDIPLKFISVKDNAYASVTPVSLPQGIRMTNKSFDITKGASVQYCSIEAQMGGAPNFDVQYGQGQEIVFVVNTDNRSQEVTISLNVYPDLKQFTARGRMENTNYVLSAVANTEGFITIDAEFKSTNAWPTDCEAKFIIDGVEMAYLKWIWLRSSNGMKYKNTHTFKSDILEQDWTRFALKPASFWIKISEHL